MYVLNKIVWGLANPTIVLAVLCLVCTWRRFRKPGLWIALALAWLWATPLTTRMLGLPLEREWLVDGRVPAVESFPQADAIHLLGGGMGGATNVSDYAEMWTSADRVWQAARLWKAGKAPRIFVSGPGTRWTTRGLLADFGVPTNALTHVDAARNTEEESKHVRALLLEGRDASAPSPKVLLVTSAWHMRRAKLMFEKYAKGLEVVPAPADFEVTVGFSGGFSWRELLPCGPALMQNEYLFHEWLGYLGYKYLRR